MDDQTSSRDFKSKDIIPILMLVGYVLVNLYGKWPRWSWILLILAALSVLLDHYSGVKRVFSTWKESRDDAKLARKAFPELQEFVRRFGQFVNRQTADTLHYTVESDIYGGHPALRADCQLPNIEMWACQRQYFSDRLDRQPKTMNELRPALLEFHYLVASYNNFCVAPIFELLPANVRGQITPQTVGKLNLFQQKFRGYLESYQLFVERLVKERPSLDGTPTSFSMPKPMV
jgi:hypothetical protein